MAGVNLATAYLTLVPTIEGIQGKIAEAMGGSGPTAEAETAGILVGSKFITAIGDHLAELATVAGITETVKKLFDVGETFETLTNTIRAGTGASGAALEDLKAIAETVATTIPASFADAGKTVTEVSQRLGLTGDSLTTVTEQFLEAGRVLGQAVDVDQATKALNGFGVASGDVSANLDALFRVSQSTGVGMNDLTSAAGRQAPAMKDLGFSFEQTVAMVGSLDKAGLNSTAMMTGMQKGLVTMAKAGEEPQAAFQRVTGEIKAFVEQGNMAGAIAESAKMFGTRGASQFVEAISNGTLSVEALDAVTANTGDTILGVGQEVMTFGDKWDLLKNRATEALKPIGEAVMGVAQTLMDNLSAAFTSVAANAEIAWHSLMTGDTFGVSMAEETPLVRIALTLRDFGLDVFQRLSGIWDTISQTAAGLWPAIQSIASSLGDAIGVLLTGGGQIALDALLTVFQGIADVGNSVLIPVFDRVADFMSGNAPVVEAFVGTLALYEAGVIAVSVATGVWAAIQSVLDAALLANPIGLIVVAVAALVAAIVWAYTNVDWFKNGVQFLWDLVQNAAVGIKDAFFWLKDMLSTVWDHIRGGIDAVWNAIQTAKDALSTGWDAVTNAFGQVQNALNTVKDALSTAWDAVTGAFGRVESIFQGVVTWFELLPGRVWSTIMGWKDTVLGWGTSFVGWLKNGITTGFDAVVAWFQNLPDAIWGSIQTAWVAVGQWGWWLISTIQHGLGQGAYQIIYWFVHLPENVWAEAQTAWQNVSQWGENLGNWIWHGPSGDGGVVGAWNAVTAWFRNIPDAMWGTIQGWAGNLAGWGQNMAYWIWSGPSGDGGLVGAWRAVTAWIADIPDALFGTIQGWGAAITSWGHGVAMWIWTGDYNGGGSAGLVGGWVTVTQWIANIPDAMFGTIQGWGAAVTSWGHGVAMWIWSGDYNGGGSGGLVGGWNAVTAWIANIPDAMWGTIQGWGAAITSWGHGVAMWMWTGDYDGNGSGGIKGGWDAIIGWFAALPGTIWGTIQGWYNTVVSWGTSFVGWIATGITDAASAVSTAIANIFAVNFDVGGAHVSLGIGGINVTTGASGTVVPGPDTGKDSTIAAVRGGEAIMVPEFTVAAGGEAGVFALNRAAEAGKLRGYAAGGVVSARETPDDDTVGFKGLGDKTLTSVAPLLVQKFKGLFDNAMLIAGQAMVAGTGNNSYDPSSFGWAQGGAANIQDYSWQGHNFGGVAAGTQGLWDRLLNYLVPQIPGGLNSDIGGYENRNIEGTGTPSFHSYGLALDIDSGANSRGLPGYNRTGQYVIPGIPAHSIASQLGMQWGGDWSYTDPMHFEIHLSPSQISGGASGGVGDGKPGGAGAFTPGTLALLTRMGLFNVAGGAGPSSGNAGQSGAIPMVAGTFGSGVEQWRPTVMTALGLLGLAPGFANYILHQMDTESSGNPNVWNTTDSNAQAGTPSGGLMQVIKPTFDSYALAPYNTNLLDPLSNILASIRYVLARYGSIPAGMRGVAYDDGGWLQPHPVNTLTRPEAVLTPAQSAAFINHAKALEQGFSGQMPQVVINLDSSDPLQVAVAEMIDAGLDNAARVLTRTQGQG